MSTARGERLAQLHISRALLETIPLWQLFELPGRPHVVYQMRSYAVSSEAVMEAGEELNNAISAARNDMPFLFKAFEAGQIGPRKMAKMHGGKPKVHSIHEYLDWTVTAQKAEYEDELDFGGFRVLMILPRYTPQFPPPDDATPSQPGPYPSCTEGVRHPVLGAPLAPLPILQTNTKPICAATIRSGPGYLEIPFVATHESRRGRGYCRCMVEAIEAIARALSLPKLMLCSTNDQSVKATWAHLGFNFTDERQMETWDIPHSDLVYLQNTVQMHKDLSLADTRRWKPVVIKHGDFRVRTYARIGEGRPTAKQPDAHTVHMMPPLKPPAPLAAIVAPPPRPSAFQGVGSGKGEQSDDETVTGSGGNILVPSSCAMDDDAGFDGGLLLEDDIVPGPLFRGLGGSVEDRALVAPDKPSLASQPPQPHSPRLLMDVDYENEDLLMDIGIQNETSLFLH